jgi:hypothetical protein
MSLDRALAPRKPSTLGFRLPGQRCARNLGTGLLSYLRGDDVLGGKSETRSLPRPGNELPLAGLPTVWSGPTYWKLASVEALATGPASFKITNPNSTTLTLISVAATGRDRLEQQPQL